jgi:putative ABC transport system substrate-binding protein
MRVWARRSELIDGRLPFIVTVTLMIFASAFAADAQQPKKVPRIGFLATVSPSTISDRVEAFRQGLRELGYVEGKNIMIEWRYAEGKADRLPGLAAELVRLTVDLIVSAAPIPTRSAKQATSTIPIVMAFDDDPVGSNFVASLARPGGSITGLSTLSPEISGKQLELLKEIAPNLSRVGVLGDVTRPGISQALREINLAAGTFGMRVQYLDLPTSNDIETVFRAASRERAEAVLVLVGPVLMSHRTQVTDLAAKNRIPAIYERAEFTDAGGLMFYGASISDMFHRAATYVDKILKGTKPADLPVEQPTKFELVINLKTAKQIGVTIPPNVLARADRVIR